jgi:hypothetical protein
MKEAKITFTPTPQRVLDAILTITEYLKEGGWCEAIISDTGGASFHLESIYNLMFTKNKSSKKESN